MAKSFKIRSFCVRQKIVLCVGLLLAVACTNTGARTTSATPAASGTDSVNTQTPTSPSFDGGAALLLAQEQCNFGARVPGTDAHKQCAAWIGKQLGESCDTVITQHATVTTFDNNRLNITNFIGVINPQAEKRLLLLAHWDCRPWADNDPDASLRKQPVMGANDGASGVAALLQLARELRKTGTKLGVDILLTDAEDWGDSSDENSWALGTQYWVAHTHVPGYKPLFGILLDMVGAEGARFPKEMYSEYNASGFLDLVWGCADSPMFVDDHGGAVTDDHVFINQAGIPCIDIIDLRAEGNFFPYWHTAADVPANLSADTFTAVGNTLLRVIATLDPQ